MDSWDMRHLIRDARYSNGLNPDMNSTFSPIIYATYGILNNFMIWDKMDYIIDNPNMIDILQNIALINIRKLSGGATSKDKEIQTAYNKYKSLILKQIEVFEPDIIIGGNTIKYLYDDLGLSNFQKKGNYPVDYYTSNEKIIIDAYHPAARIDKEQYCDSIVSSVKEWSER